MTTPTPPTISDLTVNDVEAPIGTVGAPRFGWVIDAGPDEQTAYRISVHDALSDDELWDSGRIDSGRQDHVKYEGLELIPGRPCRWRVTVSTTSIPEGITSQWSGFTPGPTDSQWGADWIAPRASSPNLWWLARREVPLASALPVHATVFVATNHEADLWVNGRRVGRAESLGYPGEGFFQAFDVTDLLALDPDHVTLAALNHWYGPGQGRAVGQPGLLVRLNVHFADGSTQTVTTDAQWSLTADTAYFGTTLRNGEGDFVEEFDARRRTPGWNRAGFEDARWESAAVLGAHPCDPFTHLEENLHRITCETALPVGIDICEDGSTIVDFGSVIPARPIVRFATGVAGRVLELRTGYSLTPDGHIDTSDEANQRTDTRYVYVQASGEQTFHAFDHLAFRYVEIPANAVALDLCDVRAEVVQAVADWDRTASFATSDPTLNAVWDLMARSARGSLQNEFVDTPTRERGQFLGDAINESVVTMRCFGERAATRKAIREFLASQRRYWSGPNDSGRYNAVYPNGDGKRDIPDYSLRIAEWVWDYYLQTGDLELVEEAYPYIRATVDYAHGAIPGSGPTAGLVTDLPGGSGEYVGGIVDWPAAGRFGYDMATSVRTTVNAQTVGLFDDAERLGRAVGRPAGELDDLAHWSADLRTAMNTRLVDASELYIDGLYADGTPSSHESQHANSFALDYGVVPPERTAHVADFVASLGMRQGPMTAHVLLSALGKTGRLDDALRILTDTDDWGWAKLVAEGATFLWEQWQPGESESHGWGATAAAVIVRDLVGLEILEPGAAQILIRPMTGLFHRLQARFFTERGPVSVAFEDDGDSVVVTIDVPTNVHARVELPGVEAGQWQTDLPAAGAGVSSVHWDLDGGHHEWRTSALLSQGAE